MRHNFDRKIFALMLSLLILISQISATAFANTAPDDSGELDALVATAGVVNNDDNDDDVASPGATAVNHAPTIKAGQAAQIGFAFAAEIPGDEVAYTAAMSDWFEDEDGDPLTYEIVSVSNTGLENTVIEEDKLTYTPSLDDVMKTVMIVVKANDGIVDSTENVTVTVTVSEGPVGIAPVALVLTPEGYTTDENGIMAYKYLPSGHYDLKGKFNGVWKSITFSDGGFATFFRPNSGGTITVPATENTESVGGTGVTIKTSFAFINSGKALKIIYEVKNTGSSAVSYALGAGADIMIGADDTAVIEKAGTSGFTMTSRFDSDASNKYAQFLFTGRDHADATRVDQFWYGKYGQYSPSIYAFNLESNCGYSSDGSRLGSYYDSVMGYSWQDENIGVGQTLTYSTVFGITGANLPPAPTPIVLQSATADGQLDTVTSTKIDLVFDTEIPLLASDITITNGTGSVVKGALTGSGKNWSLALSNVTTAGNVTVRVSNPTYNGYPTSGSPKTVTVHKAIPSVELLSATADGIHDTETSTKIALVFDQAITGLTAGDITITDGTGSARKGSTLTGSGTNWSIVLASVVTAGDVEVSVSSPAGYTISGSPKTATVHKALTPDTLVSAIADGTYNMTTSTKIDLVFDQAITGLDDSHITITDGTGSVIKGTLTGSGTDWSIALTDVITAGDVNVSVSSPAGYIITGSTKTVEVHKAPISVTLRSAIADGAYNTTESTKIDLVFDTVIADLDDNSITITDGTGSVIKGALTGSGTDWSIALTNVVTAGDVSVDVSSPIGYTISGSPKTVTVHRAADTGDVSGTVTEDDNTPIPRVAVMVTKGGTNATPLATTYTDIDGNYSFFGLEYGAYSLVAVLSDGQNPPTFRTITRHIIVEQATMTQNIQIPTGNQNTIVEVKPNTPSVAVENLEDMFDKDDKNVATTGGSVEIKLTVEKVDNPADADYVTQIRGDRTLGLYLDAELTKTVVASIGGTAADTYHIQPPTGALLKMILDLPSEHRGKSGYKVIRVHNGVAEEFHADYYSPLHTLTFDADLFSTYAIIYDAPISPPVPTPAPTSSSSSGSIIPVSYWIEVPEAKTMAKYSLDNQLDYARSKRDTIIGIRKDSLLLLAKAGLRYQHDMAENNMVQVRLYVNNPENATKDIRVRSHLTGDRVNTIKAKFEEMFPNKLAVISMEQQGSFEIKVQIAARVDLHSMDARNLYFYSYNQSINKYVRIETEYRVDTNDYLHFATTLAGDIIISDGPLNADEAQPLGEIENPATGGAPSEIQITGASSPLTIDTHNPITGGKQEIFLSSVGSGVTLSNSNAGVPVSSPISLIVPDNAKSAHQPNMVVIVLLMIIAAFVAMMLWAIIPRKSDELVYKD